MSEGHAVRKPQALLQLRLGDYLIETSDYGDWARVQSAIALLRTVFEDHYVDPEHNSCLFFHGCVLPGGTSRRHDYSAVHRGDRVLLSEFTFDTTGPSVVAVPLTSYAGEIVRFSRDVLALGRPVWSGPAWQQRHWETQWDLLCRLYDLAERLMQCGSEAYADLCHEFQVLHGCQKRPLELQILAVLERGAPRQPVRVRSRVLFGPVGAGQQMPMRLNGGDVILVTVGEFAHDGILLTLEGVGSGGVAPGDRLYGLQLFYV